MNRKLKEVWDRCGREIGKDLKRPIEELMEPETVEIEVVSVEPNEFAKWLKKYL